MELKLESNEMEWNGMEFKIVRNGMGLNGNGIELRVHRKGKRGGMTSFFRNARAYQPIATCVRTTQPPNQSNRPLRTYVPSAQSIKPTNHSNQPLRTCVLTQRSPQPLRTNHSNQPLRTCVLTQRSPSGSDHHDDGHLRGIGSRGICRPAKSRDQCGEHRL